MTKLSERECMAGISLGALEIMRRDVNAFGHPEAAALESAISSIPPALTHDVNKIHVFDSCIRSIELMEINPNAFLFRDTHHDLGYNRAQAVNVWLDRGQLTKLKEVINNILKIEKGRT